MQRAPWNLIYQAYAETKTGLFLASVHNYLRFCDLCKELALGTKPAKR
jgi:hypothetical protein